MKNSLIFSIVFLLCTSVFSQDLNYEVRGTYTRAIKQKVLHAPKLLSDVIEGYPSNWISSYTSAEISGTCLGKERKAISRNDTLSLEQQEILKNADLASKITITIMYSYQVPVTRIMEHNTMRVTLTVVPETEAQYESGYQHLIQYLKDHGPPQMTVANSKERHQVLIRFTVNEQGKVRYPKIIHSFGDAETDAGFLELIRNMPDWKPAENPKGTKVKQEFEFVAGIGGGC